jgi:hypothetical protein
MRLIQCSENYIIVMYDVFFSFTNREKITILLAPRCLFHFKNPDYKNWLLYLVLIQEIWSCTLRLP